MKRAQEIAKMLHEERKSESLDEQVEYLDMLKPEINNMLHKYLPEALTLKEVDLIAMTFFEIITSPKSFLDSVNLDE